MRPIYHQIEARVKAHIFVAALALLVQRLLARRLEEAGIDFSAERAMEALTDGTLGNVSHGRSTGASRGQRGLPGRAPGPEGIEVDGSETAVTPRGGRNRDVVTIRKIESCPPRGYVDGPQTWARFRFWLVSPELGSPGVSIGRGTDQGPVASVRSSMRAMGAHTIQFPPCSIAPNSAPNPWKM